jgi:DNA-binding response OmpR family regulator
MILCIEDNIQVQSFNKPLLEAKGFVVRQAATLFEAREIIGREMPDLIILDIHLPDGNGLDFLRELRKASMVPVIALTEDNAEKDIVAGLSSGCDDYVPKPYTFSVLLARIEALMRRAAYAESISRGPLTLDISAGKAFVSGADMLLKPKEFALLLLLAQNEGAMISAVQMYEKIWKAPLGGDKRSLQKHISVLRAKLEEKECGYTIRAVYGEGYCFEKV